MDPVVLSPSCGLDGVMASRLDLRGEKGRKCSPAYLFAEKVSFFEMPPVRGCGVLSGRPFQMALGQADL